MHFVYRTLNTNKKVKYKNFLQEVGRSWISEVQNCSPAVMTFSCQRSKQHRGDFRIHTLEKIVAGGEGKKEVPYKTVCAANKQSETGYICKFCVVPLHKRCCFEKYHSVMNY
jgi:hypothetical protein